MSGYTCAAPVTVRRAAPAIWAALAAADRPLSITEIQARTATRPKTVHSRLRRWEKVGLVVSTNERPRRFIMKAIDLQPPVITDTGVFARRITGRQRIWSALRVLKQFDIPSLIRASECPEKAVRTFVDALLRAGYLHHQRTGNSRLGTWTTYELRRKAGRIAPSINHRKRADGTRQIVLTDRNAGGGIHDISLGLAARRRAAGDEDGGED